MNPELKLRIIKTLDCFVKDAKWRFDTDKNNLDEGSQGGYSPELQEAIDLLEELKADPDIKLAEAQQKVVRTGDREDLAEYMRLRAERC